MAFSYTLSDDELTMILAIQRALPDWCLGQWSEDSVMFNLDAPFQPGWNGYVLVAFDSKEILYSVDKNFKKSLTDRQLNEIAGALIEPWDIDSRYHNDREIGRMPESSQKLDLQLEEVPRLLSKISKENDDIEGVLFDSSYVMFLMGELCSKILDEQGYDNATYFEDTLKLLRDHWVGDQKDRMKKDSSKIKLVPKDE